MDGALRSRSKNANRPEIAGETQVSGGPQSGVAFARGAYFSAGL